MRALWGIFWYSIIVSIQTIVFTYFNFPPFVIISSTSAYDTTHIIILQKSSDFTRFTNKYMSLPMIHITLHTIHVTFSFHLLHVSYHFPWFTLHIISLGASHATLVTRWENLSISREYSNNNGYQLHIKCHDYHQQTNRDVPLCTTCIKEAHKYHLRCYNRTTVLASLQNVIWYESLDEWFDKQGRLWQQINTRNWCSDYLHSLIWRFVGRM
jgi:uncharacterized paraquat-inducible protein A